MAVLFPPLADELKSLCTSAEEDLVVVSPWLKKDALEFVLPSADAARRYLILTRGDLADFLSGASDIEAFRLLFEAGAEIRLLTNLHAKVYIADRNRAILTSANLTKPGLRENVELGFYTEDAIAVADLLDKVSFWADNGRLVNQQWFEDVEEALRARSEASKKVVEKRRQVRRASSGLSGRRIGLFSSPLLGSAMSSPPKSAVVADDAEEEQAITESVAEWYRRAWRRSAAKGPKIISPYRSIEPVGEWLTEVKSWSAEKRPRSARAFIRFFHLTLEWLPQDVLDKAVFQIQDHQISLTLDGMILASINELSLQEQHRLPQAQKVWLLVDQDLSPAAVTIKVSSTDLNLYMLESSWHNIESLNTAAEVWSSFARAAGSVHETRTPEFVLPSINRAKWLGFAVDYWLRGKRYYMLAGGATYEEQASKLLGSTSR